MASSSAGEIQRSTRSSWGFLLRPDHELVLALRPVRRVFQEHDQQQQLHVRRRWLQPPHRVVHVDDGTVVDRLAPVNCPERLFVHRAPQHDGLAAGAGLLGRHRGQRPREGPRPANRRQGVMPAPHRLPPSGPFLGGLRLGERATDPAVAAAVDLAARFGVGDQPVVARLVASGKPFAAAEKAGGFDTRIVAQPGSRTRRCRRGSRGSSRTTSRSAASCRRAPSAAGRHRSSCCPPALTPRPSASPARPASARRKSRGARRPARRDQRRRSSHRCAADGPHAAHTAARRPHYRTVAATTKRTDPGRAAELADAGQRAELV